MFLTTTTKCLLHDHLLGQVKYHIAYTLQQQQLQKLQHTITAEYVICLVKVALGFQ